MSFPLQRPRRLRQTEGIRSMVRETRVTTDDLIFPLFVVGEDNARSAISAIHGSYYLSGRPLVEEAQQIADLGIPAILLFGISEEAAKDEIASLSYAPDGPVQKAVRTLKRTVPELMVITDVCLCEYTSHRHCGILKHGRIDNDLTLNTIKRIALSHAEAGSDAIAPSAMTDGMVRGIRRVLDDHSFHKTIVMPYAAKFASNLYGPFKDITHSDPLIRQTETHQIDYANINEALREAEADVNEGADILIVKPALMYLDVVYRIKKRFGLPVAAYSVSGEYSMLLAAGEDEVIDRQEANLELLTCIKRAGADMIITYFAKEAARRLNRGS